MTDGWRMKDCKDKHFFFGITCADESFTVRPVMCTKKVNRVNFDLMQKK